MTAGVLPVAERAARLALKLRGFDSSSVSTRSGRMHVYDAKGRGDLPATVVLHGIGSAAASFGPLLMRLRVHTRRVVAPDLPGHGFSAPVQGRLTADALFESLQEALDQLTDEPIVLVGNSVGGGLALRYALEHPQRVQALALISPAGARMSDAEWSALLASFKVESAREARALLDRMYHRTPWYMPLLASGFRDVLRRPVICGLLETASPADFPPAERLRELAMPTLLLWGQSERLLPAHSLEYFRRHLPEHAAIEEPEGFGHCPHIDDPERLAARLLDFARSSMKHAEQSAPAGPALRRQADQRSAG